MKLHARFYPKGLFAAALAVLVVTNLLVFAGVSANRSGEPEAQVILTERELAVGYAHHRENSGLRLNLVWRSLPQDETRIDTFWHTPAWFDAQKLIEIGFDPQRYLASTHGGERPKRPIPREAYIVLELGGAPYREALRRVSRRVDRERVRLAPGVEDEEQEERLGHAERDLRRERIQSSRLFAIDVGRDPAALRERYGDRRRYIIARGQVAPTVLSRDVDAPVIGLIKKLSVATIHVPLAQRPRIDAARAERRADGDAVQPPRYQVTLAYGRRHEPWIVSVDALDEAALESEGGGGDEIHDSDDIEYIGKR